MSTPLHEPCMGSSNKTPSGLIPQSLANPHNQHAKLRGLMDTGGKNGYSTKNSL